MLHQDRLYSKSLKVIEQFQFDDSVAAVFEDMVTRSVPGYLLLLDLLGVVAEKMIKPNSLCYDLGCSLGASTLSIRHNIQTKACKIIAIDNSKAMTNRCEQIINNDKTAVPVCVLNQNVLDYSFEPCQFVAMNLLLMFIAKNQRTKLIKSIYDQLNPGGVLFISEKIAFADNHENKLINDLHHQFKIHQGYSQLEVAQKREAIEHVLIPETFEEHKNRLNQVGFKSTYMLFQSFNFISFIAIK